MILRDPVHGLVTFDGPVQAVVERLLDAPEVQRLRRIRALGLAALAFPGAEHTRFAHAVGAAHVMTRYLARVEQLGAHLPPADRVGPDDARVALAAALLHDLGHGPYSHSFEGLVPGQLAHEDWTSRLLLDPDTTVHRILAEYDPQLPHAVERLVHGEHPIAHLARAVSGTFDVDRCDYLLRDSHMTGVRYGLLDLDWLLASLRLHTAPGASAATLAVDDEKGLTAVEGFFLSRLYMYRQVYLHKAVRAAEMVLRAMLRRARALGGAGAPAPLAAALAGHALGCADFLALDDHLLHAAVASWARHRDPVLSEMAGRLLARRLFKSVPVPTALPVAEARARVAAAVERAGLDPDYHVAIDRVEIDVLAGGDRLQVVRGATCQDLLDASQVLRELARAPFVHYRAFCPAEVREPVRAALEVGC